MSTKPLLLMLYGVKLADLYEKPVVEEAPVADLWSYTVMPEEYTKGGPWPETSNLKCWECDNVPLGRPRFVPLNYNKKEEKAGVHGHFCRVECVCAYILARWPEHTKCDMLGAARIIESHPLFANKFRMFITPTIPRTALQEYKGNSGMTRQDWEKANAALVADTSTVYKIADYDIGSKVASALGR